MYNHKRFKQDGGKPARDRRNKPSFTNHHKPGNRVPLEGAFKALMPQLQQAVTKQGYRAPTPIQEQAMPQLLEGRDLVGNAQTGTGKTAAFTLPLLQKLQGQGKPPRGKPRALILAPTRELAAQIGDCIKDYSAFLPTSHTVIFGGVKQFSQVRALQQGIDILVATPGRLLDLIGQRHLSLGDVRFLVLDEADRMLDMGFMPDIKRILDLLPSERQTMFFSATMPPKVRQLADTMLKDPVTVQIEPEKPAVDRIIQQVCFVNKKNKKSLLIDTLKDPEMGKVIVFTQMKHMANQVSENLTKAGIESTAIHGNKTQAARTRALAGFKKGRYQVMVATDVAARGIDVDDITHVFNYDLPVEAETYVHRIGRTARAGAEGRSVSFCSAEERAYLREIEKLLGQPVPAILDHAYHCSEAQHSTLRPPVQGRGRAPRKAAASGGQRKHQRFSKKRFGSKDEQRQQRNRRKAAMGY